MLPRRPENPSRGEIVMKEERETKDDGRYIIFYTFEDEPEERGED